MANTQTATKQAKAMESTITEWVIRPLHEAQGAWTKGTEWWWQATLPFLPNGGGGGSADRWAELINMGFDCAAQMLDVQRELTRTMLAVFQGGTGRPTKTRGRPAS